MWGLSTGRPWQCLAVPTEARGNPAIHDTTVDTVFTKRAADGLLWQACIARVAHCAAAKHLELSVLHGDGTSIVAAKGTGDTPQTGEQGIAITDHQSAVVAPALLLPSMRQT